MKKLGLLTILALSACGTIFGGSTQDMSFDSNQKGVQIYINGMKACKTPCTYPLERQSGSFIITAKKAGFDDQQQIIKAKINTVSILNLTFWPSWLTDVATGGMWRYSQDGLYIDMEKSTSHHATLQQIKKDVATRRYSLINYGELKIEAASGKAGEHISSLAALSSHTPQELIDTINQTQGEVNLAHRLTGINHH